MSGAVYGQLSAFSFNRGALHDDSDYEPSVFDFGLLIRVGLFNVGATPGKYRA